MVSKLATVMTAYAATTEYQSQMDDASVTFCIYWYLYTEQWSHAGHVTDCTMLWQSEDKIAQLLYW